jgi:hypothetical protein
LTSGVTSKPVIALAAAIVGGWTIVASQVFSQSDVQNLSLASALASAASRSSG